MGRILSETRLFQVIFSVKTRNSSHFWSRKVDFGDIPPLFSPCLAIFLAIFNHFPAIFAKPPGMQQLTTTRLGSLIVTLAPTGTVSGVTETTSITTTCQRKALIWTVVKVVQAVKTCRPLLFKRLTTKVRFGLIAPRRGPQALIMTEKVSGK